MPRKRIDHTGKIYGKMYVEGEDPENKLYWRVHCMACRTVQLLTADNCASVARRLPTKCRYCKPGSPTPPPAPPPTPTPEAEPFQPEPTHIRLANGAWYPFIRGPMGPRR